MKDEKKAFENGQDPKAEQLKKYTSNDQGEFLNSNHGIKINDDQNSLKSGERGASLLEDFLLREKITHFDHERIPERIVHARGSGAHGYFELYQSMEKYTTAKLFTDTSVKTPVFVRFSTVAGSKGSTDMARDARGFAVKFYTQEGNYDLVGNNIPVFFIQDAMKFPDLVHAVKPEPHNEIPQAAAAHDTFWDFIGQMPESMHMIMWAMSDRAVPRSLRMMEGFAVHTFRLINAAGESHFVKFHWKPILGVHSVSWDEAQRISGKNSDYHKQDLWEAIEAGHYPEWELGLQIIPQADEHKFPFDLLDPTKLVPEEMVPVQRIGKMTLNRNPDNFFAETEQAAFHPGHILPGIDFSNDPLLQGRLFSYTDTQLSRLGGPNFHEIPINRSIPEVHNNQRDGMHRMQINKGKVAYGPNSIAGGCPFQAKMAEGGFHSFEERVDGKKIRARSKSFFDHFSQATLFYNSQSDAEKRHIQQAFSFELGKLQSEGLRQRIVDMLLEVDEKLSNIVAENLGLTPKRLPQPITGSIPADGDPTAHHSLKVKPYLDKSAALSMANTRKDSIQSRCIAILVAEGVNGKILMEIKKALTDADAKFKIVAPRQGFIKTDEGEMVKVDDSFTTTASVVHDAVFVADGSGVGALTKVAEAVHFVAEAFKHCKAVGAAGSGKALLQTALPAAALTVAGVVTDGNINAFIKAVAQHRFWEREENPIVAA
jgi:catalase